VSEAIVTRSFLGIGEDFVGLGSLFELERRVLITRISVRMVLGSELAVSRRDIAFGRVASNTEDFVVVALPLHDVRFPSRAS